MDKTVDKRGMSSFLKHVGYVVVASIILIGIAFSFYGISPAATLRVILGILYVMFLPGYILCLVFFPQNSELRTIERASLSVGLSIPLVLVTLLASEKLFKTTLTLEYIVQSLGTLMAAMLIYVFIRSKTRKNVTQRN
jgi:uncharacterized membrane protein